MPIDDENTDDSKSASVDLGWDLVQQGDYKGAMEIAERSLELDAGSPDEGSDGGSSDESDAGEEPRAPDASAHVPEPSTGGCSAATGHTTGVWWLAALLPMGLALRRRRARA